MIADLKPSRVDLVGHSFGTHIIAWALWGLRAEEKIRIHTVILAGSVLRAGFYWSKLLGSRVERIVNDCGTRDNVLLLSQFLVLFTGMAGRTGFAAMTSSRFRNRYSPFGHGGYFTDEKGKPDDAYMRAHWSPLVLNDEGIPPFEYLPEPGALNGILMWMANNAEPVKLSLYLVPMLLFTIWVWTQRQTAVQKTEETVALNGKLLKTNDELQQAFKDVARQRDLADEQRVRAQEQRDAALRTQSMAIARIADDESDKYHFGSAMALALEFMPDAARSRERPYSAELERSLYRAIENNRELGSLRHTDNVSSFIISPRGILASTTTGRGVCLWDLDKRQLILALSPDGMLALADDKQLCSVTHRPTDAPALDDPNSVVGADVSDDGKTLVAVAPGNTVKIVDVPSRATRSIEIGAPIVALSVDPEGRRLFVLAEGKRFLVIDLQTSAKTVLNAGKCMEGTGDITWGGDGHTVLFSSAATVCTWNLDHPSMPRVVDGDPESSFSASMSDDGKRAVVELPDREGALKVVNPWTGDLVKKLQVGTDVEEALLSPDGGNVVLTHSTGTVDLWNVGTQTRHELGRFDDPSIQFSTDGKLIAVTADDQVVLIRTADATNLATLAHGSSDPDAVAVDDEHSLAYVSDDAGHIRIYNAAPGGAVAKRFGGHHAIADASFVGDQAVLTQDWSGIVRVFDLATQAVKHVRPAGSTDPLAESFYRAGSHLIVLNGPMLEVLNAADLSRVYRKGLASQIRGIGMDPDGRWFVTTTAKGAIDLWTPTGYAKPVVPEGRDGAAGFAEDISVNRAGTLFTVKMANHTTATFASAGDRLGPPVRGTGTIVWLQDDLSYITLPDGAIDRDHADQLVVWDPKLGQVKLKSPSLPSIVRSAQPDQRTPMVALGLHNGQVALWNTATNTIDHTWSIGRSPITQTEWSPDGKWLVTSDFSKTAIIDPETGKVFQTIDQAVGQDPAHMAELRRNVQGALSLAQGRIRSIAFSPDSRRLAIINASGTDISVIDIASRSLIARFRTENEEDKDAQDAPPPSVQFSENADAILSTHIGQSARIWRIWHDVDKLIAAACGAFPGVLGPEERADLNLEETSVNPCAPTRSAQATSP